MTKLMSRRFRDYWKESMIPILDFRCIAGRS
jgi:hypothetical protein